MSILWPNGSTSKPAVGGRYGDPRPGGRSHEGTDFVGYSTLYSIAAGKVTLAGPFGADAGWAVAIDSVIDGQKVTIVRFHAEPHSLTVKRGDLVPARHPLGEMGDSGNAVGECDHVEIRFWNNGKLSRADPETWLAARIGGFAGDNPTQVETDDDMAHMELVQTPDGTVWFCYDRIFRYAIPNSRNLNTYTAHLQALGKSSKLTQKSAADITAYGTPVYADPLNRYAEPRDITAAQSAIVTAIGKIPAGGGGGEPAPTNPDLAPALTALAAALKQLTDAIK